MFAVYRKFADRKVYLSRNDKGWQYTVNPVLVTPEQAKALVDKFLTETGIIWRIEKWLLED